jgi:hypothetical protein
VFLGDFVDEALLEEMVLLSAPNVGQVQMKL